MKHQALFSSKDESKNDKSVVCCNFLFGTIRVNYQNGDTVSSDVIV